MILRSRILLALAAVLASVLIQTTVFREFRPLGVAPDLVILTVIAAARWLDPQPAVLLGFTGGIVIDLLGAQVLGLRALAYTVVAYLTVRLRDRMEVNVLTCGVILVGLVAVGVLIVGVVGTLVQEQTVTSTGFAHRAPPRSPVRPGIGDRSAAPDDPPPPAQRAGEGAAVTRHSFGRRQW